MKILIVAKGQTHNTIVPYDEYDEVWVLNGDANRKPYTEKFDRWFDLHDFSVVPNVTDEYIHFLDSLKQKAVLIFENEQIPNATILPHKELLEKFTPYFTNSISWMIAYAISLNCTKLGLWGVHMSLSSEYGVQRPSCEYYVGLARGLGIDVEIQPNSTLLQASHLYGLEQQSPIIEYTRSENVEIEIRLKDVANRLNSASFEQNVTLATKQNIEQVINSSGIDEYYTKDIIQTLDQKLTTLVRAVNDLRTEYIVLSAKFNTQKDLLMNWG